MIYPRSLKEHDSQEWEYDEGVPDVDVPSRVTSSSLLRAVRHLGSDDGPPSGRAVLTVLYLCVLGLCFAIPVFYYCRIHWEERQARRLRILELAGITQALAQSQTMHRHEARAARRKFREERKARICQLVAPVKMTLTVDNFPHLRETTDCEGSDVPLNTTTTDIPTHTSGSDDSKETDENSGYPRSDDIETRESNMGDSFLEGDAALTSTATATATTTATATAGETDGRTSSFVAPVKAIDEDQLMIELPAPGFQLASKAAVVGNGTQRQIPNVCSICLCNYYPGDSVVWSSNEACEHAFHEQCILQWLMKQREGPLCPCCRRDFVIDPYDMDDGDPNIIFLAPIDDEEEDEGIVVSAENNVSDTTVGIVMEPRPPDDQSTTSSLPEVDNSQDVDPEIVAQAAAAQEAAMVMHLDEEI